MRASPRATRRLAHRPAGVVDRSPSADDTTSMLGIALSGIAVDGYADAARERRRAGTTVPPRRSRLTLLVGVAVLGLLMTLAAVHTMADKPEVAAEQSALVDQVREQTSETDRLSARNDRLTATVAGLRAHQLANTSAGAVRRAQLATLGTLAGATAATGPGLQITVDDANPASRPDLEPDPAGRILDIDLQHLVNGLWTAGAEAISINGQRLTATTAIRAAGKAITVDYRPLARPYVVQAVGDPKALQAGFTASAGGDWMLNLKATYSIVLDVRTESSMTLSAGNPVLRYAQPLRSK